MNASKFRALTATFQHLGLSHSAALQRAFDRINSIKFAARYLVRGQA